MNQNIQADIVIIGAGVIGCAVASRLSQDKKSTIIIFESGPRIAEGVTSRNSGVVHAGIYYPPKSLKAKTCITGNTLLYEWAEKHNVNYKKIGKLIVAKNKEQNKTLEMIFQNANESGARDLKLVTKNEIKNLEPHLEADSAIYSPWTGIVDQYDLTKSFLNHAENNGALLQLNCPVKEIEKTTSYKIHTPEGIVETQRIINCAGLHADDISKMVGVDKYKIYPCLGDYFSFTPLNKFNHLIYPVKDPLSPGLGVHLTIDIGGKYKLGPDTEYVSSKTDFRLGEHKLKEFEKAAAHLLGQGNVSNVQYDSCGIRPKLRSPSEKEERDFVISEDLPGFINLVGIESPGLTASMAIAEEVCTKVT